MREDDVVQTAKALRAQVRQLAGLKCDWERATNEMRAWYLMLAKRAEGLEEKLQ